MTLQLEVGKTYPARDGDVVKIVEQYPAVYERPFRGDDDCRYRPDGGWSRQGVNSLHDLVKEINDPFSRVLSALYDAERAEAEAMENMRKSLDELRSAIEVAQKMLMGAPK